MGTSERGSQRFSYQGIITLKDIFDFAAMSMPVMLNVYAQRLTNRAASVGGLSGWQGKPPIPLCHQTIKTNGHFLGQVKNPIPNAIRSIVLHARNAGGFVLPSAVVILLHCGVCVSQERRHFFCWTVAVST